MYQKIVNKGYLDYCFLKIRLDFPEDAVIDVTHIEVALFKSILQAAVNSLHGLSASASQIDILKYNLARREAIVRIHSRFLTKFWSSLTLYGSYRGQTCAFRVLQVSAHLMAMSVNSRTMKIEVEEN